MDTKFRSDRRVLMHKGRPHMAVSFAVRGKREHPVTVFIPPENADTFDHDKLIENWQKTMDTVDANDEQYRAYEGKELDVCHRKVTISDFKIVTHGLCDFELVMLYHGTWARQFHHGKKSFRSTSPDVFPTAEQIVRRLAEDFKDECVDTHAFAKFIE
jgi:hypothetical protein